MTAELLQEGRNRIGLLLICPAPEYGDVADVGCLCLNDNQYNRS